MHCHRNPFYFNGTGYSADPLYVKPWYSNYFDAAVGCIAVCPIAGSAVVASIPEEAVAVEGPQVGYRLYGKGRLAQIRFFQRDLIFRLDVNDPITHLNVEGRIFSWEFNFHLPPF